MRRHTTLAALFGGGAVVLGALGLRGWRAADLCFDATAWRQLLQSRDRKPRRFHPDMVADLPEPARRYFLFSIRPGTELRTAVELEIRGEIGLGTSAKPRYLPMKATQILAAPEGFVWQVQVGSGLIQISGSDGYHGGEGWTRFWLFGGIPIVRAGGSRDFARSAAARGISEALFWSPAALLPRDGIAWSGIGESRARVSVSHSGETYNVDLTVDREGRPISIALLRWSRENPERIWRYQPFGGDVQDVSQFGGFTIASRVEGGNHFGTPDYFPFYRAGISAARFH